MTKYIIVDCSKPDTPTFSYYTTSKTVHVYGWSSWDNMSNTYTTNNNTAGIGGIKHYVLKLGSSSKTIAATGGSSYDFNASPNTSYTLSVTAVDMAGNSQSASENVSTPPAKVTGLSFSNVAYTNVKLSWKSSAGATSYQVNMYYNGETTTVGNNVTTTSFTIPGLSPDESYDLYVIAQNSAGASDVSDKATVTTAELPVITGNSVMCSGNYSYSIPNLLPGYTITWSSQLTRVSAQGSNPCTFNAGQTGNATINATLTDSYSTNVDLRTKKVWTGLPMFGFDGISGPLTVPIDLFGNYTAQFSVLQSEINAQGVSWYDWSTSSNITMQSSHLYQYDVYVSGTTEGRGYIYFHATNTCGTSISERMVRVVSSGGGPMLFNVSVYPNPASSELTISSEPEYSARTLSTDKSSTETTIYQVRLYTQNYTLVREGQLQSLSQLNWDIRNLSNGIYYLHITHNGETDKRQIVIKK